MTLELGQTAGLTRSYTDQDMCDFARLSGNPEAIPATVPGPLIGGLFSYLLGVELPGRGTNYLKQSLEFLAPAPVGQELSATVTITRLRPEKHLADLETRCVAADGTVICQGRALVYVEDVGKG